MCVCARACVYVCLRFASSLKLLGDECEGQQPKTIIPTAFYSQAVREILYNAS